MFLCLTEQLYLPLFFFGICTNPCGGQLLNNFGLSFFIISQVNIVYHFHFVSSSVPWQWFQSILCCSTPRALDRRQSGTWDTEPKPFIPFVISLRQYAVIFVVVIYLKSIQMEKLIVNICIQINILDNKQQAPSSSFQCTKEQSGLSRTSLQLCDWRCDWLNKKGFFF